MPPKRAGNAKKRGKGKAKPKPVLSPQELFEAAQQALEFDEYDQARVLFQQCVKGSPDNVEYLDAFGAFLAETGEIEEAVAVLRRSMELSPDAGYEKYMYLGQLLGGEEAVALLRQGIDMLQQAVHKAQEAGGTAGPSTSGGPSSSMQQDDDDDEMEEGRDGAGEASTSGREDVVELQAQLAGALCSLAEMLMHSVEDMGAVAEEVEELLKRAKAADAASPEPLQAMASLRYETGRPEEALALLKESLKLWFKEQPDSEDEDEECGDADVDVDESLLAELGVDAADVSESQGGKKSKKKKQVEEEEESDMEEDEEEFLPSYEFRIETAKLLVELDDSTDIAVQILEDLLNENDEVPEVWHLLAYAYYGSLMLDEAEEVAGHGAALAAKLGADEDLMAQFEDLRAAIAEAKAGPCQEKKGDAAAAAPAAAEAKPAA